MKFSKYFRSMYYVTIAVLFVVAAIENIGRGFPVNLVVAVVVTSVLDVMIKKLWLKRKPAIPQSAIITGLIVGSVSLNAPIVGTVIAAILAILSKFVIRLKGSHIFNPAVFGVVVSQLASPVAHGPVSHGSSQVVEGFGIGGLTVSLPLVPLLILANWRAKKLWISIPFLIASAILYYFTGLASLNSSNIQDVFRSLEVLPYYFAFIIVSEPKTTPYLAKEQLLFGMGIAILSVLPLIIFGFYSHVVSLVTLLAGNLIYAIFRANKTKSVRT